MRRAEKNSVGSSDSEQLFYNQKIKIC